MLPMVTDWVDAELVATVTGVGKVMVAGATVRLGLTVCPVPVESGSVEPVMRTVRFWSSVRVVESAEGAIGKLYVISSWQTVWGRRVVGQRSVSVNGAGRVTGVWGMELAELLDR